MPTANTQAPASGTGSSTIADLLPLAAANYAGRASMSAKADGRWSEITYAELGSIVAEIALGLLELGVKKGDRVAILCNTRPEWTYAYLALTTVGGAVVPIYPNSSPDECAWVLGNSEAKLVICEDASQLEKLVAIQDRLPALERVIMVEQGETEVDTTSLEQVRERGHGGGIEQLHESAYAVAPEDVCTIVYTSGTTGRPKGCVLSHRNFRATLSSLAETGSIERDGGTYLFLPLAHVFSLVLQLWSLDVGARMAYFGGDPAKVIEELQEVKPTYFPSVPRIFEKIHASVEPAIKAEIGDERFAEIVALGAEVRTLEYVGEPVPDDMRQDWDPINEQVFERVRQIFGGRVREAATGAAPIDKALLEFFYAAGIPVLEGYGMTEATTAITVSTPERHKFGTVGRPLPGIELKIAEDGEILVKGDNVFEGYYGDEQATAEAVADGWLHTGDLGSIDAEGYLSITGRKKDIIITAGGKNLTPSNLENDLKRSRYVSQAVMHGDRRPFPTMLVTLDPEAIAAWAGERGKPEDVARLAKDPDVAALIQETLDEANSNYASAEQVKKFFILDHELSQEAGELTPTMKVKRNVVNERYAAEFEALY